MTYHHYRRHPGPIAALFWLMIAVVALIALAEVYPPVTAPLAIALVVAIVWAAVRGAKARQRAAVVRARPAVRRWQYVERKRGLAPCSHCGAPNKGNDFCPFCGCALTTSREVSGVSEG